MENKNIIIEIDDTSVGIRIDVLLKQKLEEMSRSQIQKLIDDGNIKVNNKTTKSNYKARPKDIIAIEIPSPKRLEIIPENIDIEIVYEDEDIAIINKPQGMVVHPAAGNYNGTLVNALLAKCTNLSGINGVIRPGIVHRIDKDTSGILVIAKNDRAHRVLSEQIKEHTVNRIYVALVEGTIKEQTGTVNMPIGRHPVQRKKMAINKNGRIAITHYRVIENFKGYTLIEVKLETGRTHQIRVHMAHLGHPVVGDPVYGFKKQRFHLKGQALHAKTLGFIHPGTDKYVEFSSKLPEYFEKLLILLRSSNK